MRRWRVDHPLTGDARRRAIARAYLRVYVRRGKVVPTLCEVCGVPEIRALHLDFTRPLLVRWLCVAHHREAVFQQSRKTEAVP
jgi:hypothetical protein